MKNLNRFLIIGFSLFVITFVFDVIFGLTSYVAGLYLISVVVEGIGVFKYFKHKNNKE